MSTAIMPIGIFITFAGILVIKIVGLALLMALRLTMHDLSRYGTDHIREKKFLRENNRMALKLCNRKKVLFNLENHLSSGTNMTII